MRSLSLLALALTSSAIATPASAAPDGKTIYARCAACHLSTGTGVPGAFPAFDGDFKRLSATPAGRRYLALVVIHGVAGTLTVDAKTYRGAMPPQPLDDAGVANVLNFIATGFAKAGKAYKPFTPTEVARIRASGATLNSSAVAALHPLAGGK